MSGERVPLKDQIGAVAEAVTALAERLDRLVEVGRMAKQEADAAVRRLRAALDTLLWVQNNAEDFVALSKAKKRLMEDEMRAAGTAAQGGDS